MQHKPIIAIIEDERDMMELLEYNLHKSGFDAVGFLNTSRVLQFLDEENVDLMIVDRNLPDTEGSEFIKKIRGMGYNVPVIFLSAKTTKTEQLQGFDAGGDDYITKPFDLPDLIARINAVLKRTKKQAEIYKFKEILVNLTNNIVMVNDDVIELTKLEINLLVEFIRNRGILLTREYFLEKIWGYQDINPKTINIAVKRLREKIDPNKDKNYIKSIRGEGYMLC